jgi:hypothetical protein
MIEYEQIVDVERIDFKLSDQVQFDKFIGCISDNREQEVIDFLAAIPRLAKMFGTDKETALYKALKEKNTSEIIIYALIRAGHVQYCFCLLNFILLICTYYTKVPIHTKKHSMAEWFLFGKLEARDTQPKSF